MIEQGKLAVVIGIESSDLFGCSEFRGRPGCTRADIDRGLELYHRLGVRTMFPVHWVDNAFGGAALEGGGQGQVIAGLQVRQTGEPFRTETCSRPGEIEQPAGGGLPAQCNSLGLTSLGAYAIRRMMADAHDDRGRPHEREDARHRDAIARPTTTRWSRATTAPGEPGLPAQLRGPVPPGRDGRRHSGHGAERGAQDPGAGALPAPGRYFGVGLGTDTGGLGSLPGPRPDAAAHPLHYPFRSYDGKVEFVRERTGEFTYDLNIEGVAHYGLLPDLIADIQQGHGDRPGAAAAVPTRPRRIWRRGSGR